MKPLQVTRDERLSPYAQHLCRQVADLDGMPATPTPPKFNIAPEHWWLED